MNNSQLKYTVLVLYVSISLIFILGIIIGDIYLFVASTILLILTIRILIKHPNLINIPRKLNIGSEVAYEKTFFISNIILFYVGIAIITLRNSFPKYEVVGYCLLIIIVMNIGIFKIIQKNLEKEYLK